MGFIEGKCDKCNGILQIPDDRKKIICMYCGEEIEVEKALALAEEEAAVHSQVAEEAKKENYDKYMTEALAGFTGILLELEEPLKYFKKKVYEKAFHDFVAANKEVLHTINNAYMVTDEPEVMIEALAKAMTGKGAELVRKAGKKRRQEEVLMDLNVSLVAYVFPFIMEYKSDFSEPLADKVIECWSEEFPKTNLSKATFEQINSGFKVKFCYITTTLCEGLGKPDNCYELTLLRNYRDGYLASQPDGEEIIQEYYDIAPTIVKKMKRQNAPEKIYQKVYEDYLLPCIHLIEEDKNEECKEQYIKMVRDLQKQFMYNENTRF